MRKCLLAATLLGSVAGPGCGSSWLLIPVAGRNPHVEAELAVAISRALLGDSITTSAKPQEIISSEINTGRTRCPTNARHSIRLRCEVDAQAPPASWLTKLGSLDLMVAEHHGAILLCTYSTNYTGPQRSEAGHAPKGIPRCRRSITLFASSVHYPCQAGANTHCASRATECLARPYIAPRHRLQNC
jgi:hypothetical protein